MSNKRNRTSLFQSTLLQSVFVFCRLSLRNVVKAFSHLNIVKRSHAFFAKSGSGFRKPVFKRYLFKGKKISEYIVDETLPMVGSKFIRLWIAIEPKIKHFLDQNITQERNYL